MQWATDSVGNSKLTQIDVNSAWFDRIPFKGSALLELYGSFSALKILIVKSVTDYDLLIFREYLFSPDNLLHASELRGELGITSKSPILNQKPSSKNMKAAMIQWDRLIPSKLFRTCSEMSLEESQDMNTLYSSH